MSTPVLVSKQNKTAVVSDVVRRMVRWMVRGATQPEWGEGDREGDLRRGEGPRDGHMGTGCNQILCECFSHRHSVLFY
jgi:hypothetical protein